MDLTPSLLFTVLFSTFVFPLDADAGDPVWQVTTHTGIRFDVNISGNLPDHLSVRQVRGKNAGQSIPLQIIERLQRPNRICSSPGVATRQVRLGNGDRLHSRLQFLSGPRVQTTPADLTIIGPDGTPISIPWRGIQSIGQSPGTHSVTEQDFENEASGWMSHDLNEGPQRDQAHAFSGKYSLVCTPSHPLLRYSLSQPLRSGWIQLRFFSEIDLSDSAETLIKLQFDNTAPVASQVPRVKNQGQDTSTVPAVLNRPDDTSVQVSLSGPARHFECRMPAGRPVTRQFLPHHSGWHTLTFQFSSTKQLLSIDGNLLASSEVADEFQGLLQAVELTAQPQSAPVWIDDFLVMEESPGQSLRQFQNETDEILLKTGDQLFGSLSDLNAREIYLESGTQGSSIPWKNVAHVRWKVGSIPTDPVFGWNCRVDFQPLWTMSDWREADFLHGALLGWDDQSITIHHGLLGIVSIPTEQVRQIKPFFWGFDWTLEGRPIHLGDEIEPRFQSPSPFGTRWSHPFFLKTIPEGRARFQLTTVDLEPSNPKAKTSSIKDRLLAGEYLSELRLNGAKAIILNQSVTGKGSTDFPQSIIVDLPSGALRVGQNSLEIILKPSRDEVPQYDDWELRRLSLEIE